MRKESGVRSQGSGVRSQGSGVRGQESGVRSGVRGQESGVRGQGQESGIGRQRHVCALGQELIVYQKAYALAMRIFDLSKRFPAEERFA